MNQICDAVYEKGSFRLIGPAMPGLSEGQHVRLEVSTLSPEEQLALAARFYAGLSEEDIEEIERIVLDRSRQRQTLSQH